MQIFRRVFFAVDILSQSGECPDLTTLCKEVGLHGSKYREIRANIEKGVTPRYHKVDVVLLNHLIREYRFLGDWLIAGRGEMRHESKR